MSALRRMAGLSVMAAGAILWTRAAAPVRATGGVETPAFEHQIAHHDFGRLVGAVERTAARALRNESDETWVLRRTWSECGCVKLASATERVEPGETAAFTLHVDTAEQPGGPLRRKAFALYDPGPRLVVLTASAVLAPGTHAVPYLLDVEIAPGQIEWTAECAIESPFAHATVALESASEGVSVALGEAEAHGADTHIPFICTGILPSNQARRSIELRFRAFGHPDEAGGEPVVLRGVVRRRLAVSLSPRVLVFAEGDGHRKGSAWLRRPDGTWPDRVELESAPEGALAAAYDPSDGEIHVELSADSLEGGSGTVRAVTSEGEPVELTVRVARMGDER